MSSTKLVLLGFVVAGVGVLGGCASVMSGRETDVAINSTPAAAQVAVKNEKGQTVATGVTPAKFSLKRGNGFFKKAPRYVATIEKPGFEPARVPIHPKVNPWIAGNVVLGGVIGLAADSATGAMWKFSPTKIDQQLTPYGDDLYSQTQDGAVSQTAHVAEGPRQNEGQSTE